MYELRRVLRSGRCPESGEAASESPMSAGILTEPSAAGDGPGTSEREEALWCEVVRLRHRLKQVERDNELLRELLDLRRQVAALPPKTPKTIDDAPKPRYSGRRLSADEQRDIAESIERGERIVSIARRLNVTPQTIHRYRNRCGRS